MFPIHEIQRLDRDKRREQQLGLVGCGCAKANDDAIAVTITGEGDEDQHDSKDDDGDDDADDGVNKLHSSFGTSSFSSTTTYNQSTTTDCTPIEIDHVHPGDGERFAGGSNTSNSNSNCCRNSSGSSLTMKRSNSSNNNDKNRLGTTTTMRNVDEDGGKDDSCIAPSRVGDGRMLSPCSRSHSDSRRRSREYHHEPSIRFGNIEIIEFPWAIGNNPGVSGGVPLSLGEDPIRTIRMPLERYERSRRGRRRHAASLIIRKDDRMQLLLDEGYERYEIVQAVRESYKHRRSRERSYNTQQWDGVHEKLENTGRKLKKIVHRRLSSNSKQHSGTDSDSYNANSEVCESSSGDAMSLKSLIITSSSGGRLDNTKVTRTTESMSKRRFTNDTAETSDILQSVTDLIDATDTALQVGKQTKAVIKRTPSKDSQPRLCRRMPSPKTPDKETVLSSANLNSDEIHYLANNLPHLESPKDVIPRPCEKYESPIKKTASICHKKQLNQSPKNNSSSSNGKQNGETSFFWQEMNVSRDVIPRLPSGAFHGRNSSTSHSIMLEM